MATHETQAAYAVSAISVRYDEPGHATADLPLVGMAEIMARSRLATALEQVEARLIARTASRSPQIAAAGLHTIRAGGKRLRASVALLAAGLGNQGQAGVLHAAAAAELIHAASLVHDDLVDAAAQRRGRTTVHMRWTNNVALMLGDYFFALAADEMALAPDKRVIATYAQAVQTIVEGELSPVLVAEPLDEALTQYLFKTGSKTAALFEAACKAGMICGFGSEQQVAALGRYGYDLGMAFQIVDDILDYTGDERVLGKPAGNDLRQGTITLPLIYAVANGASPALLDSLGADDEQVANAIAEVRRWRGAVDSQLSAERYARRAESHLAAFAPSAAREALVAITQFVVARGN